MRRIWAAVLSVWATIAVVATLAWANAPAGSAPQAAPVVYVQRGGKLVPLAAPAVTTAAHATTRTS